MVQKDENGYTLLEVTFSTAIFSFMICVIFSVLITGHNIYSRGLTSATMETQARNTVERLTNEIQQSSVSQVTPVPPAYPDYVTSINYRQNIGYQNGQILWGPQIVVAFKYAGGEQDNGIDDNGNGLIDEGLVERQEGGNVIYIIGNVKEQGLQFSLERNLLRIRLEMNAIDSSKRLLETAVETRVEFKNPSPQ